MLIQHGLLVLPAYDREPNVYKLFIRMRIPNKLRLLCVICLLLVGALADKAYCNDREELLQIESYLNSLKHIVAKFTQVDSNENMQKGNFFLSRPGRLKWE